MDTPSIKYKKAVAILRELMQQEGLNVVSSAYAEATYEEYEKVFISKHNVKPSKDGHCCINRLKGSKHCPDTYNRTGISKCNFIIPGQDHLSEWKKDRKTFIIVSQPYELNYKILKETVEFCDKHGLEASIRSDTSWHCPGSTLIVEYICANDIK